MEERKWIGFVDSAEVGTGPAIDVERLTTPLLTAAMRDVGQRTSLTIRYQVGGA